VARAPKKLSRREQKQLASLKQKQRVQTQKMMKQIETKRKIKRQAGWWVVRTIIIGSATGGL
jgi:hypothetical protein